MESLPQFFVYTGAPISGFKNSFAILAAIGTESPPTFEQYLIAPESNPPFTRQVYRHSGFSAEQAWEQQVSEAEHALDNRRLQVYQSVQRVGEVMPRFSKLEPVPHNVLMQLWIQHTHREALQYIHDSTECSQLRAYISMVIQAD